MFSDNYLGSFQIRPRYNPATERIPFLPGVFATLPYAQQPIPRVQPARLLKSYDHTTRLGALSNFP